MVSEKRCDLLPICCQKVKEKTATICKIDYYGFCWWSHLGSNQGPTDYESATDG